MKDTNGNKPEIYQAESASRKFSTLGAVYDHICSTKGLNILMAADLDAQRSDCNFR